MTTNDDTIPRAGLDLDAVGERIAACVRLCDWQDGEGCGAPATQRCEGGDCGLRLCDDHGPMHAIATLHNTARLPRNAVPEARELLAEARRLRGLLDATAQVWRATGETHEPPADVAALTDRVDALRCEVESYARRLAGRDETNANLLGRLIAAENTVTAARREGAEAMREACVDEAARRGGTHELAAAIHALPLPGGKP